MKRSPLKRKTPLASRSELDRSPLKRKAPVRRKRKGPPRKGRERDPEYIAWLHTQPCIVPGCTDKRIEAHHHGKRGVGQKCDDREACSMCGNHHRAWWHDKGHLPGMSTEESRELITRDGERLRKQWEMMR